MDGFVEFKGVTLKRRYLLSFIVLWEDNVMLGRNL